MTWLDFGGQRSRSQQRIKVHLLVSHRCTTRQT